MKMHRKILQVFCIWCLLFSFLLPCLMTNQTVQADGAPNTVHEDDREFSLHSLTSTDAVGRTLNRVSGYEEDKYVGLFYFLWHGQHDADKPRNITQLLRTHYDDLFDASPDNKVVPYDSWLHYQEPLFGYYSSMDEWVMRKHIEMFIAADVDFLVLDFTNAKIYNSPLRRLMDLLLEYKAAGWDVPELTFYVNQDAQKLTNQLYKILYSNKTYQELAFYGNSDKPIIISVPHLLSDELNNFFDVRASQWYRDQYGDITFPYWTFSRTWKVYKDMVNISVAQTGTAFGYVFESWDGKEHPAWGRGYSSDNPQNGNIQAILEGANFQEGWDAAISLDPDIVFITGWNEWVVQKRNLHKHMPELCPYDFPDYTDNFNVEYSRDLEMTKVPTYVKDKNGNYVQEGYGDNYYLQLVYNIRKYKGLPLETRESYMPIAIDIDGDIGQWEQVRTRYVSLSTQKVARDADGFYEGTHYTQTKPNHFIQDVKVTYDNTSIYFCITTQDAIGDFQPNVTNWMNLFIGVNDSSKGQWNSFNYVVNRHPKSDTVTSLEYFTGNGYETKTLGEVQYRVQGNKMQIEIPREMLGFAEEEICFTFKMADGIQEESNILDYYVSGESFPLGRMAYIYETKVGMIVTEDDVLPTPDNGTGEVEGFEQQQLIIAIVIILLALIVSFTFFVVFVLIYKKKRRS